MESIVFGGKWRAVVDGVASSVGGWGECGWFGRRGSDGGVGRRGDAEGVGNIGLA